MTCSKHQSNIGKVPAAARHSGVRREVHLGPRSPLPQSRSLIRFGYPQIPRMRVYLETFGCQMNELDSELVRSHLVSLGHSFVDATDAAEVILLNTCSVREQAEQKAYSRIGIVGQRKRAGEQLLLGVIGCMAERDGIDILRRFPQVDLLCGPSELDKLPALIDNAAKAVQATRAAARAESAAVLPSRRGNRALSDGRVALAGNRTRRTATLAAAEDDLESLDLARAFQPADLLAAGRSAYVRITRGCNKFCTYCVVPNTRGAEVHRPPDHIVEECRKLADAGAVEVTLLGQTVNHYRYVHGAALTVNGREAAQVGPGLSAFRATASAAATTQHRAGAITRRTTSFADLLRRIHEEVPSIARLRFLTSYPRDFGNDVLQVMQESPRICRYLHAPAQSGSDRILKLMNRGYEVSEYLEFIERVRDALPDACIAGDFIVGFPTETDDDFEATCQLIRTVRFKNNFIFKYSPRPGTVAIDRFPDDVSDEVKRMRNNTLLAVQAMVGASVHREWVGRTVEVFIEGLRDWTTPAGADRGNGSVSGGKVHLAWEGPRQAVCQRQAIGRTGGDLIVAASFPSDQTPPVPGSIHKVRISGAAPLLLTGSVVS
ncbi:MAG: MiaB/RimO family radical SAM methylthiotransferase [Phycisphaerales bacterium]|nr:MiaB/RimO family radical SAM methylthiotransferase [Phycisphaerales bacterium]